MNFAITDMSQRKAAKVSAIAYLVSFATMVFTQFNIHDRLIVRNDAVETGRNIIAHEQLFRIGIACDLLSSISVLIMLVGLYIVFRPVNRTLALVATFGRFIYALMWILMTLNLFNALRLLTSTNSQQIISSAQLQGFALSYLDERFDQYYVGLLFCGLASMCCGYLWFKSGYIPRAMALFGIISSSFCAACTLIFIISPGFTKLVNLWWFDTPMGIFDITISFWLLFKGLKTSKEK